MRYKLVIFDLDGTILYTLEDLTNSVNYALEKSGYNKRSLKEVRSFVGNGIRKLIERVLPDNIDEEILNKVHKDFMEYYKIHCADNTKPYDGIISLLKTLRSNNIETAVISNKADYAVKKLCKKYFDGLFDCVVGERIGIPRKPAPDSVYNVISEMKIDIKDAVYIGDSDVDINTAKNAKMDCIIVDWGFKDRNFLIEQGAENIVSDTKELLNYLL